MELDFKPLGNPSVTETVKYQQKPITLGERINLWGTEINRTKAPSNIINFIRKYIIRR